MQHANTSHPTSYVEPEGLNSEADETDAVVVLMWAVPTAAIVPAPRQGGRAAIITLRPVAISSTVPASVITELRANNTVLPTSWCTTATLAAPAGRI